MDGLLKVHQRILDADADSNRAGSTMCTRLLLAATQAGNLIGKQGATIKTIQDSSNCVLRVLGEGLLENIFIYQDFALFYFNISMLITVCSFSTNVFL